MAKNKKDLQINKIKNAKEAITQSELDQWDVSIMLMLI